MSRCRRPLSLFSPRLFCWRRGGGWGMPAPPLDVLSFIWTVAATVLFQVHPRSVCLCLWVTKSASAENKMAV
jgi:hypothetical protein